MQKNHFLLSKTFKNTESAQLWALIRPDAGAKAKASPHIDPRGIISPSPPSFKSASTAAADQVQESTALCLWPKSTPVSPISDALVIVTAQQ